MLKYHHMIGEREAKDMEVFIYALSLEEEPNQSILAAVNPDR